MDLCERQVAIHKSYLARIGIQQSLIRILMESAAERTLEVAEFHNRDRRIVWAEAWKALSRDVIADVLRFGSRQYVPDHRCVRWLLSCSSWGRRGRGSDRVSSPRDVANEHANREG